MFLNEKVNSTSSGYSSKKGMAEKEVEKNVKKGQRKEGEKVERHRLEKQKNEEGERGEKE